MRAAPASPAKSTWRGSTQNRKAPSSTPRSPPGGTPSGTHARISPRKAWGPPSPLPPPLLWGWGGGPPRLTCEIDMAGIYAKQKDAFFNALLLSGRTRFGHQRAISRQEGVRPALAALREGIPFYYLPDQDYGPRDAIFVPFFAASSATITGLSRMTRLTA